MKNETIKQLVVTVLDSIPKNTVVEHVSIHNKDGTPFGGLTGEDILRYAYREVNETGVKFDGLSNDTASLQNAANLAQSRGVPLRLPPGTALISTLVLPSGLTVIGSGSNATILKAIPSAAGANVCLVDVSARTNVGLQNLRLDGDKASFSVSTEHRHALRARGTVGLTLFDVEIVNPKGDGIYVGMGANGTTHSRKMRFTNVRIDGSHRNGLSIIDLTDGVFVGCEFLNSSGTNPQAGVDIEPNFNTEYIRDIRFVACTMSGNVNEGFLASLKTGGVTQGRIKLIGCSLVDNGGSGAQLYNGRDIEFSNCSCDNNGQDGIWVAAGKNEHIRVIGGTLSRNGRNGFNGRPANGGNDPGSMFNVKIIGVDVLDNSQKESNVSVGIMIACDGDGLAEKILIDGVTSGNRDGTTQQRGFQSTAKATQVTLINSDLRNNISSPATFNEAGRTRFVANVLGLATTVNVTDDTTLAGYVQTASVSASSTKAVTITLPIQPEEREYIIYDNGGGAATNNITIVAYSGTSIRNVSGALRITKNFGIIRLYYRANNWFVVSSN